MSVGSKINKELKEIYDDFKKDNGDRTGWSLMQKLKEEADYEEGLIQYFIYSIFKIALQRGEVINIFNLLTELISYPYYGEKINQRFKNKNKEEIEFFPGVFISRGILTEILESLGLKETQRTFYYYLVSKEEEINEKFYLGKKTISKFEGKEISSTRVLDVFREEYKQKKLNKKSRIIKLKNK